MHFDWTAPDGEIFPCERWLPPSPARGVLICIPGMGGEARYFGPLAEAVNTLDIACYAMNLRGQGLDPVPSRRGALLDLEVLAREVNAFTQQMRAAHPTAETFWICGESMGALLVSWMLAHARFEPMPRGAIFSVPVVELKKPTPWVVRETVRFLARVVPAFRLHPSLFVSGKSEQLPVTRDQAHLEKVRNSPTNIRVFTFRFLAAMGALMNASRALAAKIKTPSLVLAAGQDVFIRPEQVEAWFRQMAAPDKTFRLYPEAHHLLWNDWDKEAVLADILAWLKARAYPASPAASSLSQ